MKRIKILHLINEMEPGGAENLLLNQINLIDNNRFDIFIGYLYGNGEILDRNSSQYTIVDFSSNGKFSYSCILTIMIFVISNDIEIIHTHLIQASVLGRLISKLIPKIKCITTRHYAKESKPERLINRLENSTLKYSDKVVCISDFVAKYIDQFYVPEDKKIIIYNGIKIEQFTPSNTRMQNTIGTVGRLTKQKGLDVLINSISKLRELGDIINLEIIGDGELKEELMELTSSLNLTDQIKFYGRIPYKEVLNIMKNWSVFALPSRWEGFGLVFIEAMAFEIPIVGTKIEAIPDVVHNHKNGILVEIDNVDEICNAVRFLLMNKETAKQYGKDGRIRVLKNFDIRKIVSQLEKLYEGLVNENNISKNIQ